MKRHLFSLTLGIIYCGVMIPSSLPAQVFLDSASFRCKYEMSYKEDTTKKDYKKDLIYLDMGRDASHCYSFYTHYRDSVQNAMLNEGLGGMEVGAQTSGLRRGVEYMMAKQYKTRTLLVSDRLLDRYMYTETIPTIDWQVTQDTCTILSYPCRKATAQFRGRSWVAWFTTDIPQPGGPWQFGGLPGLILRLEDTQKHYIIACTGIEQFAPLMAMRFQTEKQSGAYKKLTREQFAKLKREMYTDAEAFMRDYHSITVHFPRSSARPYNPIELE